MVQANEVYETLRKETEELIREHKIGSEEVECATIGRGYSGEEVSSTENSQNFSQHNFKLPSEEYALAKGEEVLLRCKIGEYYGDAFTNKPRRFQGQLEEVLDLNLEEESERAIFFSTLNAALGRLGNIKNTVHCKDDDPKKCGKIMKKYLDDEYPDSKIAHLGYQPGHVKHLAKNSKTFVTDLNPNNIGEKKFGTEILPGSKNEEIIKESELACISGSCVVNGTLPQILKWCGRYNTKPIIYGVSGKGAAKILGIENFCPLGRNNP